ncbi:phosphotyrosine-specific ptp2-like protein, partial [Coemansia nantahalensis]
MGLSLGMDVGMAGIAATASAALLGAGSDGPPPTARGSWTMDSRDASPALQPAQGARWGDSAPPTPGLSIPGSQGGLRPSRLMDIAGNYSLASSTGNSMGSAPFSVATVAASAAGSLLTRQRCADPQPSSLGAFNAQAGRHSDAGEYKGQLARSPQAKSPRMKSPGRVSGLSYISAADMAMRLSEAAAVGRQGVIIDTRRSADYVRAHITDAANMCVSSTLAKRKTFTIDRLLEMQRVADEQRRLVTGWKSAPWVVLYSDGLPEQTAYEDTQLVLLARKFTAEAPDGCEVHVLQCGFDEFARSHGSLCTSGGAPAADAPTIRPLSLAATMPASTASAHRVAMGRQSMACPPPPTLMIDHPMLRTMRQTPGGGGFDPNETVAMRLPHDFSSLPHVGAGGEQAPQRAQALPAYLCRAADPATGPALLTRLFGRIDASETRRMSSMIENNGMVTEKNSYTISVGLELGSKNRYTNIYPFDSNR